MLVPSRAVRIPLGFAAAELGDCLAPNKQCQYTEEKLSK